MPRKPNSLLLYYKDILIVRVCSGCKMCIFDSVHKNNPTTARAVLGACAMMGRTDRNPIVFKKIRTMEE